MHIGQMIIQLLVSNFNLVNHIRQMILQLLVLNFYSVILKKS